MYFFIQNILFRTLFPKPLNFFLCHSQVILQAVVTVPMTSMMSFSYLSCGLPLLLFPAIIHLIMVFQHVRVIYLSVYIYINLDRCFNSFYLIYFIKHIILIQRNQISSKFTFKYLYTNQISVFTRSFLNSKLNLSTLISITTL